MSLAQWSLVFGTVLGWLLIIIFMMTVKRRLIRLRAKVKLLSDEINNLKVAEEGRLMTKINDRGKTNARRKRADHAHSEPPQTTAPPVVPAHLDVPANAVSDPKHWRDCAEQMRIMSDRTKDAATKATMLKVADDYDALAERCGPPASTSHH
jgi:hypothetical protein